MLKQHLQTDMRNRLSAHCSRNDEGSRSLAKKSMSQELFMVWKQIEAPCIIQRRLEGLSLRRDASLFWTFW